MVARARPAKAIRAEMDRLDEEDAALSARLGTIAGERARLRQALEALGCERRGPSMLQGVPRGDRSRLWKDAAELLRQWRGLGLLEEPHSLRQVQDRLEATGWRSEAKDPNVRSILGKVLRETFGAALQITGRQGPNRRFAVQRYRRPQTGREPTEER